MAQPHQPVDGTGDGPSRAQRADAVESRHRILEAASEMAGDRRASMTEIAAAAGVARATVYRHFPTKAALLAALAHADRADPVPDGAAVPSGGLVPMAPHPPGRLGSAGALPLEVTHVLDEIPPHLIADQLVAEARRAAGVAVALYVVDIDGSHLWRIAGSPDFPARLKAPPALGPEIVAEGLPGFAARLRHRLPQATIAPLWLRGRVIGILLCVGTPMTPLDDIAKQGAAALELANDYTDLIEDFRRRKATTAAAEVQLALLPPRVARVTGAQIAGGLLPSYEVAGDWFDYVENRDGTWLAVAEATGTGATAAGFSAAALGALRAARRSGQDVIAAARAMDTVLEQLGGPDFVMTLILARWHAATSTLEWVNCGHPPACIASPDGELALLEGPVGPPLGRAGGNDPPTGVTTTRLRSGDRLILLTNGVIDRHVEGGGTFGMDGVRSAVQRATAPTAAATALAIQQAVTSSWSEPLEDDATLLVLAVD